MQRQAYRVVRLERYVIVQPTLSVNFSNISLLQVKKVVNYAESSGEDDDELFAALQARKPRHRRSRAAIPDDEEDEDTYEAEAVNEEDENGNSCPPSRDTTRADYLPQRV